MDPVTIGMMAAKATGVAANVVGTVGKKVIEVGLPLVKQAGSISLRFVEGGIDAVKSNEPTSIKLTKNLNIIDNGLSVPLTFGDNQVKKINQEIREDLNIIKGQNEILFLSNSIKYFVDSHTMRTGIDRGISYALQYDIKAVINHIKKNEGLRFPGYLLHQCTCLAETVKEYNIFYDSVLNHGLVHEWTLEEASDTLERRFGVEENKSVVRSYIPFEYQIPWKRNKLLSKIEEEKKSSTWKKMFESEDLKEINDEAHDALFILSNELCANESLEYAISQRIEALPKKHLLIQSPETEN